MTDVLEILLIVFLILVYAPVSFGKGNLLRLVAGVLAAFWLLIRGWIFWFSFPPLGLILVLLFAFMLRDVIFNIKPVLLLRN